MGREHLFDPLGPDGPGRGSRCDGDPSGVTEALEAARTAAGLDVHMVSDDELMSAATTLEAARGLLEAASAHVLARLDAEGTTDAVVGMRTGTWLAFEANSARSRCRARVRTAQRLLNWFPVIDEAIIHGRLGWPHGETLCAVANHRNASALGEAQEALVAAAAEFSFEQWAALVRHLAADLDTDGGYDPNADLHANRLRLSRQSDRTVEVTGRLVGDAGVSITHTLETLADELLRDFRRDNEIDEGIEVPGRSTLMALALQEACRRALAVDLDSTVQPGVEAVVVIEDTADGPELHSTDGSVLPHSAATLLVDPTVRGLLMDGEGVPLRLGRRRRFATADLRLALAVRDGGCIFPGCDRPPGWCDVHHQPSWQHGGRTDPETSVLECRHHHVVTHRPGWTMEPDPDRPQRWIWITPSGRVLRSQRRRDHPRPIRPGRPGGAQ